MLDLPSRVHRRHLHPEPIRCPGKIGDGATTLLGGNGTGGVSHVIGLELFDPVRDFEQPGGEGAGLAGSQIS